ncbi:MAG: hypothetical protein K5796_05170 [Lachnospiraceae bacterium]|nr:hypothetical protein [Lachnospiraceae bacterium]
MKKINFMISSNTYTDLRRYANLLNISIPNVIRFIFVEEIYQFDKNPDKQKERIRRCAFRKADLKYSSSIHTSGKEKDLNYEVEPKKYSIQVSDYIYDGFQSIKKSFPGRNTNEISNDLIHIYMKKLELHDLYRDRNNKVSETDKEVRRYALPSSHLTSCLLEFISRRAHMSPNQLIAIILGDYLITYFSNLELEELKYQDKIMESVKTPSEVDADR